ncbi:GntR family transcriptional regulator [Corallococcus macrosporus]|uniref:GntR family transcriptional regulator n=1 Tax=Corallococcus macrosporus TaxID=35 RepID=A0ABS3DA90_9BACT|nr:GntR family transcriptional regulator [Corallococcus macrosporus]MBN8228553.1 GntR family transcriptional regulator [Corallococcus macrosporus]
MVRVGLVAYVEEQLERYISLGMLPRGQFASEEKLAREFGCCRGTVREAFRRLAARGLVVQRPGRKTRAVALDESLTLENLGLALHDPRSEEGQRLLEGFFCLKRQVLVELLVDCCAKASASQIGQLESVCYALRDAARWEPGARCAQLEFELLRLAAHAAARPGHLLLIQSLQRALRGNAVRLLSFMGGEALGQWATCAMHALNERDVRTLQLQLPALLKACDEGLLGAFAPPREPPATEAHFAQDSLCDSDTLETPPCLEARDFGAAVAPPGRDDALESCPCVEAHGLEVSASTAADSEASGVATGSQVQDVPQEPDSGALRVPAVVGLVSGEPGAECADGEVTGAAFGDTARVADGPLHVPQGSPGRWAARIWRFIARFLGRPSS